MNNVDNLFEGVETRVGVDFFADRYELESLAEKVVYTGPIDRFYDYQFGELGWRSLRFETEVIDTPNFQGNAVVNYTDSDTPYTRVIEHKHFEMFGAGVESIRKSVVSREYPQEWRRGSEPYYPIDNEQNRRLHAAYAELAACEKSVLFGGRLAEYRYYDMDDVIRSALDAAALEFQA